MPTIVDPNPKGLVVSENYGYTYPKGLDLRPGSTLHQKVLTEVYQRARESYNEMSKKYASWKLIDESLTAYIDTDEAEEYVKDKDSRKPVSIVVPYTYATLETILTYFVSAFLENPIFRYEGTAPEDVVGAIMLEKVIDQNCQRAKVGLNLHTMFRDSFAYGFGAVHPGWEQQWGYRTMKQPETFMSQIWGKLMPTGRQVSNREDVILYEGNKLTNIDPYLYLPDPNVPISESQRGEFVGWIEPTNYMSLLSEEQRSGGNMFNVKYLKGAGNGTSSFNQSRSESGRDTKTGNSAYPAPSTTNPVDVVYMYITLIPKDWGLSSKEYPEKWLFGMGADKVIIKAKPMGLDHNMYPVAVASPDFDGYSVTPISRLEMLYGLQEILNFMMNSHVANVRKAINDMLIVDPSLINIADLKDPQPGKLIRMRRSAWGRGVENAVKQLAVVDVTKNHISDSSYIIDLFQRCSAAADSVMGVVTRGGERISASESNNAMNSALSRLAKSAKITSMQAMHDIGYMFASHSIQLMSKPLWVTTSGRWSEKLAEIYGENAERFLADPSAMNVGYDVMIKDNSMSGGTGEVWVDLFRVITQQPALLGSFDVLKIFKHIARMMGAKDVDDFQLKGGVPPINLVAKPDAEVAAGAASGALTPVTG